jgi:hypothetical protein
MHSSSRAGGAVELDKLTQQRQQVHAQQQEVVLPAAWGLLCLVQKLLTFGAPVRPALADAVGRLLLVI